MKTSRGKEGRPKDTETALEVLTARLPGVSSICIVLDSVSFQYQPCPLH